MGLTHLDAGVVIGLLNAADAHHHTAKESIAAAVRAGSRLEMAASAYAECLVGPSRIGDEAVGIVRDLVSRLPIEIVGVDSNVAEKAAALRAQHSSLRLPDALVLAAAQHRAADDLITTDRRWPAARKLGMTFAITTI